MEIVKIQHNLKYILAKRIIESPSMTGAIIYGGQRLGKSSYALTVAYDVYRDWNKVMANTFFKLEDLLIRLKQAMKNNEVIPVLIWDDAGVHASKQLYFTKRNLTMYLQALTDVMGTACKGLLMTTPNPDSLLKSIRGYEFYRIKITKYNQRYDRIATGYKSVMLPSGTRLIQKDFKDYYNAIIPDNGAYDRYKAMRSSYLSDALTSLEGALEHHMTGSEMLEACKDS